MNQAFVKSPEENTKHMNFRLRYLTYSNIKFFFGFVLAFAVQLKEDLPGKRKAQKKLN